MTGCRPEFQTRAPGCARRGSCGNRRKHKIAEDRKRRNRIRVTEDRVPEYRDSEQPESESQRKDSGKKTTPTPNEIRSRSHGPPE